MDLLDEMEMENALATGSEPASDDQSGPARRPGHLTSSFAAVL